MHNLLSPKQAVLPQFEPVLSQLFETPVSVFSQFGQENSSSSAYTLTDPDSEFSTPAELITCSYSHVLHFCTCDLCHISLSFLPNNNVIKNRKDRRYPK